MQDIENYVVIRWASKWKQLGSQLNVGEHVIRNIEYDHQNDCEGSCSTMLSRWLEETDHPTWEMLISACDKASDDPTGLYIYTTSMVYCNFEYVV